MKLKSENRQDLAIEISGTTLRGDLIVPDDAGGIVVFAHGSGSGRKSSRNRFVAQQLHGYNLGTLLFDLLTLDEERVDAHTAHLRFDIPLLAGRLRRVTEWLLSSIGNVPVGYFGASTGAAAALIAAAELGRRISAVVSRGGRPDLAGRALSHVASPTLLIVGGEDHGVIDLNEKAFSLLTCEKRLEIVPGATHLFEEPGTLEQVSRLAGQWLRDHLISTAREQSV